MRGGWPGGGIPAWPERGGAEPQSSPPPSLRGHLWSGGGGQTRARALQAVVPEWPGVRRGKTLGTVWVPHEGGSRTPSAPVSGGHVPRGPQRSSEDAETTADGMLPDSQVFVCESHGAVVTSTTDWRLKARESILSLPVLGLQVRNQGVGRAVLSPKPQGEDPSCPIQLLVLPAILGVRWLVAAALQSLRPS